ncbi:Abi family protein [Nocardioides sp. JQ2195]|uniref:Abi family protein n=1 Tax=Nocardioides sp. JQ2195 TaxID=2592334 RepID=UPI00143E33BF|nr:Abi family protein [Nocardioides sp. JQ2195]QIX25175.1 Abi family protein [Nocardioides sp. JQ2195]
MVKPSRARGSGTYGKPALTLVDLVDRLADRGLDIPDRERATRYLRHLGYFRLSPYTIPFQLAGTDHQFRADVAFDDVLDLYVFDRALRLLVLDALERIEVAIRSALTDHMSLTYGDTHWYVDPQHFRDQWKRRRFLDDIAKACDDQLARAAEDQGDNLVFRSALEHYLTTYGSPRLPPSWLMVEMLTVGSLDHLVRNLGLRADKTAIARTVGLNAVLLESWLRTYVRVRNICAHHGRLWNVGLGVYPALPTSRAISWLDDPSVITGRRAKQLYPVLVSLQSVLNTISPNSSWAQRLSDLLAAHPHLPLRGIGAPEDWRQDPFWAAHIEAI